MRFSKEKLSSSNGQHGDFEAAVFGWCPVVNRFAIYQLRPRLLKSGFDVECSEHLSEGNQNAVAFGSGATRLMDEIEKITKDGDKHHRTGRLPLLAAERLVEENKLDDVGGSLSIGLADKIEFRLFAHVTPIVYGFPAAKMTFNGIDLQEEIGPVGHHVIAVTGIA